MRPWLRAATVASSCLLCGCASKPHIVVPPGPTGQVRIADADALVRAGCLDCLLDAFKEYDSLRSNPAVAEAASAGAVQAAILIALRERDLGLLDSNFVQRARELATASSAFASRFPELADIIETIPRQGQAADDADLTARQKAYRNRDAWLNGLESHAIDDAASAYTWLAFNCAYSTPTKEKVAEWVSKTQSWSEAPLIRFKAAGCGAYDADAFEALLSANPRFLEANYFLGLRAMRAGKLDDAAALLQKAYEWRPRWPAVTQTLASLYLSAEEFEQAVDFYDRTLEMHPGFADALLGKAKALTYLGRHDAALDTIDQLLALEHWYIGDARYWRALNEAQLARYDDAWTDVEIAAKLLLNAEVPKLAGRIAYNRKESQVSRERFELSRMRNPTDCETSYYLQLVLGELADWPKTAEVAAAAAVCLADEEIELAKQIENIRAKDMAPAKKEKQIAKREQRIANDVRMRVTSWYNAAVSNYNLKNADEARRYAEKVVGDDQFGDRARQLLARLR